MSSDRVFDLGLTLAGGSTRGAYSAGVMDFILQALDELESKRATNPTSLPPWRVRIKTIAGTSAGGITAAVATASICTPYEHLSNSQTPPDPKGNNLFNVWVNQVSLEDLFKNTDLDPDAARRDAAKRKPVRSLLNSQFLIQQAKTALDAKTTNLPRPAWSECLQLYITTSNLRGIPYEIEKFTGAARDVSDLRMTRHRDWVGFKTAECSRRGLFALNLQEERTSSGWDRVRVVAQGTATLPLIFPLIKIRAPLSNYEDKLAWGTPAWPELMPDEYVYDAVDGGIFRNAPLELVRDVMEFDAKEEVLAEKTKDTRGAVILLHPSPRRGTYETAYDEGAYDSMFSILWGMLTALMEEANFQERDLEEIANESNISRFLIAPIREGRREGQEVLATDTFRGFGGIIGKDVRLHDFQLGRRNAQKFLRSYFVVPLEGAKENRIFGEECERFAVRGENGMVVPIVPLVGSADQECPKPIWPSYDSAERSKRRSQMHDTIAKRAEVVLTSFAINLDFYKTGFKFGFTSMWNWVLDRLVGLAQGQVMKLADKQIDTALNNFSS